MSDVRLTLVRMCVFWLVGRHACAVRTRSTYKSSTPCLRCSCSYVVLSGGGGVLSWCVIRADSASVRLTSALGVFLFRQAGQLRRMDGDSDTMESLTYSKVNTCAWCSASGTSRWTCWRRQGERCWRTLRARRRVGSEKRHILSLTCFSSDGTEIRRSHSGSWFEQLGTRVYVCGYWPRWLTLGRGGVWVEFHQ